MLRHDQVALRRQQAQEEAEARQLGVEILKPGDRADLVMGAGGVLRRQQTGEAEAADTEAGDSDAEKTETESRDQTQIKVDTTDLPDRGMHTLKCVLNIFLNNLSQMRVRMLRARQTMRRITRMITVMMKSLQRRWCRIPRKLIKEK